MLNRSKCFIVYDGSVGGIFNIHLPVFVFCACLEISGYK